MKRLGINLTDWHTVFAWWPVTTIDGYCVWWEHVERRMWGSSWFDDYFEYRILLTYPKRLDEVNKTPG